MRIILFANMSGGEDRLHIVTGISHLIPFLAWHAQIVCYRKYLPFCVCSSWPFFFPRNIPFFLLLSWNVIRFFSFWGRNLKYCLTAWNVDYVKNSWWPKGTFHHAGGSLHRFWTTFHPDLEKMLRKFQSVIIDFKRPICINKSFAINHIYLSDT